MARWITDATVWTVAREVAGVVSGSSKNLGYEERVCLGSRSGKTKNHENFV